MCVCVCACVYVLAQGFARPLADGFAHLVNCSTVLDVVNLSKCNLDHFLNPAHSSY